MLRNIGEHTIDDSLLSGGVAIDVGCLGFEFSRGMKELGCEVHAFDLIDMEVTVEGIFFSVLAVTAKDGTAKVLNTLDRQAWHLNDTGQIDINTISINKLYKFFTHNSEIDVLKLDCEGSEYQILSDPEFQPIPRQITVEFHAHCQPILHNYYYDKCMENLLKHYEPVQHVWEKRHGCSANYWDSLFIRRDLL